MRGWGWLTANPVLHFQRLWVIFPSRLDHHLFGRSKESHFLRPSVGELVRRGVMRGLGIERRWRMGCIFIAWMWVSSPLPPPFDDDVHWTDELMNKSIIQYENWLALGKQCTAYFRRRMKISMDKGKKYACDALDSNSSSPSLQSEFCRLVTVECKCYVIMLNEYY